MIVIRQPADFLYNNRFDSGFLHLFHLLLCLDLSLKKFVSRVRPAEIKAQAELLQSYLIFGPETMHNSIQNRDFATVQPSASLVRELLLHVPA